MTENLRTTASEYFGNKYSPKYLFKLKNKEKEKQQCNNIHEYLSTERKVYVKKKIIVTLVYKIENIGFSKIFWSYVKLYKKEYLSVVP